MKNTGTHVRWEFTIPAPAYKARNKSATVACFRCTADYLSHPQGTGNVPPRHQVELHELLWHNENGPDTASVKISGGATPEMLRDLSKALLPVAAILDQQLATLNL